MKKAYCCHVRDSSLPSSQNPCDFCNKSNCLFPQEFQEHYIGKVGERWHFLVPSQLSSVAGMDLPAAMEEENEVNSGSLTSSRACSLREGCAKHLVVPSNPPSASSFVQVEADWCRGARQLSFPAHPADARGNSWC